MKFVKFMTGGTGRGVHIVLGPLIMGLGLFVVRGPLGWILPVVALILISGDIFDFCMIGFGMGYPHKGAQARRKLASM